MTLPLLANQSATGSVALSRSWRCQTEPRSVSRSDNFGEFGERRRNAPVGARIDPEFIVAAAQILHERVDGHDHAGGAITLEATHRSQPRLEPAHGLPRSDCSRTARCCGTRMS